MTTTHDDDPARRSPPLIRPHGLPAQDRREVVAAGEAVALDQGTATRARSARRHRVAHFWRVATRWRLLGPLGAAILAGLALDTAFAPLGWWPIAIPATALVMLFMRGRTWRQALLLGFAVGLAQFAPLIAWLTVVTPVAWIALTLAESAYIAVLGVGLAMVVRRVPAWPVLAALLWVSEELVRTRWPLDGFGWGRLAFSQPDTPFTGYAAIAGAPLVTFAVALSAAFLAAGTIAAREQRPRKGV
jgi:apolipoprotein N-acyltransferase